MYEWSDGILFFITFFDWLGMVDIAYRSFISNTRPIPFDSSQWAESNGTTLFCRRCLWTEI